MRNLSAVIAMLFVATVFSYSLERAKAEKPEPENPSSPPKDDESIEVRLARAHLQLAKLDLHRAMEANKQIPNVLPDTFIETLQLHVVIDEEQLRHCLNGEHHDSDQMCIRRAEARVKIADADMKRTRAVHERMQSTTSKLDLERATAVANIARLNLERTREPEHSESIVTHLQWQIDDLRHQVLELQMEMTARR